MEGVKALCYTFVAEVNAFWRVFWARFLSFANLCLQESSLRSFSIILSSIIFGLLCSRGLVSYIAPTPVAAAPVTPVTLTNTPTSIPKLPAEPKANLATKSTASRPAVTSTPATSALNTTNRLYISSVGINTPVQTSKLIGRDLQVPATAVGAYSQASNKTLLMGHTPGVFTNLKHLRLGQNISYNNQTYRVTDIETLPVSAVRMSSILAATSRPTIVLMTCAGQLSGTTASHRLIITAVLM